MKLVMAFVLLNLSFSSFAKEAGSKGNLVCPAGQVAQNGRCVSK